MFKLPFLASIRRYRADKARVNKYPCLSLAIRLSPPSLFVTFMLAMELLLDVKKMHTAYVASTAWHATAGNFISGSLTDDCWWRQTPSKLKINYGYVVDGRPYNSEKVSFSRDACGSGEDAREVMDFSAPPAHFTVYYNPVYPHQSVLVRKFYGDEKFFVLGELALKLYFFFILIRAWPKRKLEKFRTMRGHIRQLQRKNRIATNLHDVDGKSILSARVRPVCMQPGADARPTDFPQAMPGVDTGKSTVNFGTPDRTR